MEEKVNKQEEEATQEPAGIQKHTVSEEECLMPTMQVLPSKQIKNQVDARIRDLQDKGKFKSERGGHETVLVKHEVP